ncbi:MAG TPA: hypothetical protein VML94_03785 [Thermoplasmata archaeon]|nr:hypothetical protein [Thermoplasmata archaeon]
MASDSDADEIQREREQRQAAERRRIDSERVRRKAELDRLRAFDGGRVSPRGPNAARARDSPGAARGERAASGPPAPTASGVSPPPAAEPTPPKVIGGPIRSGSLREFLAVDPSERFDLQALNVIPLTGLVASVADDPRLLATLSGRLRELMSRVKQEVDDPLGAGAFLRERVLEWYRLSASDPAWLGRTAPRWAGLFADSRVSGGRLHPWLNLRLWAVREEANDAGRFPGKLRRGILRDRRSEQTISRTPSQLIQAEVAQALLDDLVSRPRDAEAPLPLVRLSELAVRRQVTTVNDALALLFSSPENGPFVILHPNRYPDCDELVIRPPAPGSAGAALAYSLASGRPNRRSSVRLSLSSDGVLVSGSPTDGPGGTPDPEGEVEASTIWEAEAAGTATWIRVVEERRRERRRLDAPPKDFRSRPAYPALKELILGHAEFRKALLAAKWRGRPTGLPLLVALLQKGKFTPEVATDYEYLEAELDEWADDGPEPRSTEGVWAFGEWTVRREGSPGAASTYRAERSSARPAARS